MIKRSHNLNSRYWEKQYKGAIETWEVFRMLALYFPWILPIMLAGLCWFFFNDIELTKTMSIGGFIAGLVFFIPAFPTLFVKRTETPSAWQRFFRSYTFVFITIFPLLLFCLAFFPIFIYLIIIFSTKQSKQKRKESLTYFKYWLSHPFEEVSQEKCQRVIQINTKIFDWQDSSKWPL